MNTTETPRDTPEILERNLKVLQVHSPQLAERILAAPVRNDLRWISADDASPAAEIRYEGETLRLCSFHAPQDEAIRLAETFDPKAAAAAVILGFGLGYHVRAIAQRLKSQGVIVVIEPDLSLLRTVLGVVDHSGWLLSPGVRIHTEIEDLAAVSRAFETFEGYVSAGMTIVEHPSSRTRLRAVTGEFMGRLATVVGTIRTHVITTLCQVEKTVGHHLSNAAVYANAGSVEDLKDAAIGRAAVVVSAGPSLARNVDLLARPGVRDRVVIIAAQTVLKPLLARGIRPHYVTALDHADISSRFFESLTAEDVRGVTLVIEPKANPAIPAAFPGEIRCARESVLDDVLGPELARSMGSLPSGSTVAHLSYYLARHLGCDPVIFIGQDLGFTDGQYYAAGAAIHQVWSGELNEFNTLEMLEWQRIMRMRRMLHKASDHLGRDVYTDEQMLAYRLQFEREFGEDRARGLRVIDATEGGVRKEHATIMTLAEALDAFAGPEVEPWTAPTRDAESSPTRKGEVVKRLTALAAEAKTVKRLCDKTQTILGEIYAHAGNNTRVNPLIEKTRAIGTQAEAVGAAYRLIQYINQTGQLKRFRRDRLIALDETASPVDKQRLQVERDRENMRWLGDAADELGLLTARAIDTIQGVRGAIKSRDRFAAVTGASGPKASAKVGAVIPVNPDLGGLNSPRDLAADLGEGKNILQWTVSRLLRTPGLDRVILTTHDAARVKALLGDLAKHAMVRIHATEHDPMADRRPGVAAARRWSRACWRGGLGDMTAFDEAFAPAATLAALDAEKLDAAILVGPDWPLIDPVSLGAMLDRYRAAGGELGSHQLMLVHAAPGLGACLLERGPIQEMVDAGAKSGPFASIGALIGYLPFAPQPDLIGKPAAMAPSPAARDLGVRCIADSPAALTMLRSILSRPGAITLTLDEIAGAAREWTTSHRAAPEILNLDLGDASGWMDPAIADARIREAAAGCPSLAVTMTAAGDPLAHPQWACIVRAAKSAGAAVHLRTSIDLEADPVDDLLASGVDVISVDLLTAEPAAYRELTGRETFERAWKRTERLSTRAAQSACGLPEQWIVARMTRRDSEYARQEFFYDHWLMKAGACVIDPLPAAIEGERIAPLPVPACVIDRRARETVTIGPGGEPIAPDSSPQTTLHSQPAPVLELKPVATTEAA